ncbi:MAG: hypothetical protein K6253_00750 [Candidatus Liberibacter asiaticus]|nr:hypothetical protein [Candidatus Liberibacter asiaticus]
MLVFFLSQLSLIFFLLLLLLLIPLNYLYLYLHPNYLPHHFSLYFLLIPFCNLLYNPPLLLDQLILPHFQCYSVLLV